MAAKPTRGRRASGLRAIAATLPGATRRLRQRRGLAQSALFQDWPAIVGDVLATQCYPQRLVRGAAGAGGTLHLGVAGPLALELQHLAPQVIERINTYFGFAAVARLTLHQVAPMAPRQRDEPADTHPTPDSAAAQALDSRLRAVSDPELRAALDRLGRAVLAAPAPGGSGTRRSGTRRSGAPG